MSRRLRELIALITALFVAMLALAGCSGSGGSAAPSAAGSTPGSSSSAAAFPRDVTVDGQTVHLEAQPKAIVILSPSLTETVYGIGAGGQVKAVDALSNYPADAPKTDLSAFKPNAEAVAAMQPDLVLMSNDNNNVVASLTELKIPVAVLSAPMDVQGALDQFATVGQLTGHEAEAAALTTKVQGQIDTAVASVKDAKALSYYWELGPELYTATSKTFIGSALGKFNLTNIADKAPDAASGYPQLSSEFIVDADPDLIFVTGGDVAEVKKRPGWDVIRAVKDTDGTVAMNDDISSRWGPRIGDLAEQVAAAVTKVQ